MKYIQRALAPGETAQYLGRLHWILWVRAFAALIFLGIFAIGVVIFIRDLIALLTTEIAITNRRIILKKGWLTRHTFEMELSGVEAAKVDQDIWGRALNFGRIEVHGTGDDVWRCSFVSAPLQFRRELEGALMTIPASAQKLLSEIVARPANEAKI